MTFYGLGEGRGAYGCVSKVWLAIEIPASDARLRFAPSGEQIMNRPRIHGSKSESIRKITKTGKYTYYVTIPKGLIEELGWRERQNVRVSRVGKKIEIEKVRR